MPSSEPLSELLASSRPATWVFTGDSITQGVQHTHGARCWVEHVHERIRFQLGRPLDAIINTGVSGWSAPDVAEHFDRLVGRYRADVVSIALGMNDCLAGYEGREGFRRTLTELAVRSGADGARIVLHTPNAIADGAWNVPVEVAAYAQVVREVADGTRAVVVDHFRYWCEVFGEGTPQPWLDEAVHPNAEGHRAMAALTLRTLGLGELQQW